MQHEFTTAVRGKALTAEVALTGSGEKRRWVEELGPYLTMGIQLALGVVVFFFLGRWLDSELGTAPWLMIVGLAVGTVGGFIKFFRAAQALGASANREAEAKKGRTDAD